jgi:hypothetical protein
MRPKAPWPVVCLLACAAGCHALTTPRGDPPLVVGADPAPASQTPRTIPVEIIFVRFDEHDATLRDEAWNAIDEQACDEALRGRLATNGLRVGVVSGDLPPHIAERILPDRTAAAPGDTAVAETPFSRRLLRLLPGRRSEIIAAAGIDELVLLETGDGQVRGGTFRDATGLFSLQVRPAADGRVRIDLVPEIKHGPLERSWVGEDGMFRMETSQRRHRREDLALSLDLRAGGLLVVGCAGDTAATLGDALLRDRGGHRATMRMLVIRPLGQTVDPLFAESVTVIDDDSDVLEVR